MTIIPVMDLMNGVVVHARRGERDNYRPVVSTLCPSAAPEAILRALVEKLDCDMIYIADLDAIRFQRPQLALIDKLKRNFPTIQFWLDAGISDQRSFDSLQAYGLARLVVGSESTREIAWLASLEKDTWILSLDFKENRFLGDATLFENTAIWPQRILAMNLAQVGSESGPDFALLKTLRQRKPDAEIYAAGGVRDNRDLVKLQHQGIHGALVATALHSGTIVAAQRPSHGTRI